MNRNKFIHTLLVVPPGNVFWQGEKSVEANVKVFHPNSREVKFFGQFYQSEDRGTRAYQTFSLSTSGALSWW